MCFFCLNTFVWIRKTTKQQTTTIIVGSLTKTTGQVRREIEPWSPGERNIVGSKGSNHDIPKGYNCFPKVFQRKTYLALRDRLENHDCASFVLRSKTTTIIVGSKGSNHDIWPVPAFFEEKGIKGMKGYNCFPNKNTIFVLVFQRFCLCPFKNGIWRDTNKKRWAFFEVRGIPSTTTGLRFS